MNRKNNPWVSLVALILLAVILVAVCTGCNNTKTAYDGTENAPKMMTVVDSTDGYAIYKHDETGVYYFCCRAAYGRAVCVMVNADGTPYTGEAGEG